MKKHEPKYMVITKNERLIDSRLMDTFGAIYSPDSVQ
ncbi:hypothetical protein Acife_3021 [Acidithiobacillus ferrivorans SS3]|uniref:Uncharacterized protein n=1 Tax=Acidithiobacillus ferrivorans SS3 TaxID=743299 RepID=G0JUC5_9PROT|nr:hypothetical protein Acife_3021 [Acidithiobacillus ferrivorans SS3]